MSMAEWGNYNWPLISFSFDDGGASTYNVGLPLFQSFGAVACAGIVATYPGNEAGMMSWAEILELQAAGWEICCHSYDHDLTHWNNASEEIMTSQLITTWEILAAQGCRVNNYICPGATVFTSPASVFSTAKQMYHSARSTNLGVNEMPMVDTITALWALKVQYLDGRDITTCKAVIDAEIAYAAKGARHWIQFYGHQFNAEDVVFLTELLMYIQSKNLGIYTTQQALDIGGVVRWE